MIGLGDDPFRWGVYLGNRPPLAEYEALGCLRPAATGELASIVEATGNHWRKIFTLCAKLGYALNGGAHGSWQEYRDSELFCSGSGSALLFSAPPAVATGCIHIVAGKAHAAQLGVDQQVQWLDDDFAVDHARQLVVTPYFDYRQLSNQKLARLLEIIEELRPPPQLPPLELHLQ